MSAPRLVVAIESSCDESAVALVRADGTVLAQEKSFLWSNPAPAKK